MYTRRMLLRVVVTVIAVAVALKRPLKRKQPERSRRMSAVDSEQYSVPTRAAGWVQFAGVILIVNGIFSAIQGFAAIVEADIYYAAVSGDLWLFDLTGWGWFNMILGALQIATAFGLFAEADWARVVAIILVVLSALVQTILLPLQPWWAMIVIAIDINIIYALIVRGGELRQSR